MTLMRSNDPDLFHQWHAKHCDETSEEQRQSCVITKMSNKMSTVELAKLYLLPNDFRIIIE
ncbi:unnamed protein product [Oikopleura dioica]|nr:unnamed protein product [Oikopleura dioica]